MRAGLRRSVVWKVMALVTDPVFNVNDRVVTTVDLGAVPAGTPGRVILRNGISSFRYRVFFDIGGPNGTDVGHVTGDVLARADRKGNRK